MPILPTDVRLACEPKTTPGTLYYECQRCGRKTKTYRKITQHLRGCTKNGRLRAPPPRG
jgi:ribosomal protein S14